MTLPSARSMAITPSISPSHIIWAIDSPVPCGYHRWSRRRPARRVEPGKPQNPRVGCVRSLHRQRLSRASRRTSAVQAQRVSHLDSGKHELTAFFLAYYGFSRVPGLIPLSTPVTDDTIDPRQMDLTHTTLSVLTDRWRPSASQQLQLSGYLRTYSLDLKSNFGQGLIRQSEFRTVVGGNATYNWRFAPHYTLLGGVDFRRDAPRGLDLAKVNANGVFQPVTSNDLTITDTAPFLALNGIVNRNLQVYAGVRRDQIDFNNVDRITPANSFDHWPGLTSPKFSVTLGRPDAEYLPSMAFSFAKAFHANDPRIGTGSSEPSLTTTSRAYQLVATKVLAGTEFRILLEHITSSQEFANIDPDTGLQEALGPSLNRFFTVGATRRSHWGFLQASYSQANATDLQLHQPVPEAPRLIVDALGNSIICRGAYKGKPSSTMSAKNRWATVSTQFQCEKFACTFRKSLVTATGSRRLAVSLPTALPDKPWKHLPSRMNRLQPSELSACHFAPTAALPWSTSSDVVSLSIFAATF